MLAFLLAQIGKLKSAISSISNNDSVKSADIKISNTVYGKVYRSGNAVSVAIVGGSWDSVKDDSIVLNGTENQLVIPSGYRPAYIAEIKEALNNKRITIGQYGTVISNENFTGVPLRFSGAWITNDAQP